MIMRNQTKMVALSKTFKLGDICSVKPDVKDYAAFANMTGKVFKITKHGYVFLRFDDKTLGYDGEVDFDADEVQKV